MRRVLFLLGVLVGTAALASCSGKNPYLCLQDVECAYGRCLPQPDGARFCAFSDSGCPSTMLRWDAAADHFAGLCLTPAMAPVSDGGQGDLPGFVD